MLNSIITFSSKVAAAVAPGDNKPCKFATKAMLSVFSP